MALASLTDTSTRVLAYEGEMETLVNLFTMARGGAFGEGTVHMKMASEVWAVLGAETKVHLEWLGMDSETLEVCVQGDPETPQELVAESTAESLRSPISPVSAPASSPVRTETSAQGGRRETMARSDSTLSDRVEDVQEQTGDEASIGLLKHEVRNDGQLRSTVMLLRTGRQMGGPGKKVDEILRFVNNTYEYGGVDCVPHLTLRSYCEDDVSGALAWGEETGHHRMCADTTSHTGSEVLITRASQLHGISRLGAMLKTPRNSPGPNQMLKTGRTMYSMGLISNLRDPKKRMLVIVSLQLNTNAGLVNMGVSLGKPANFQVNQRGNNLFSTLSEVDARTVVDQVWRASLDEGWPKFQRALPDWMDRSEYLPTRWWPEQLEPRRNEPETSRRVAPPRMAQRQVAATVAPPVTHVPRRESRRSIIPRTEAELNAELHSKRQLRSRAVKTEVEPKTRQTGKAPATEVRKPASGRSNKRTLTEEKLHVVQKTVTQVEDWTPQAEEEEEDEDSEMAELQAQIAESERRTEELQRKGKQKRALRAQLLESEAKRMRLEQEAVEEDVKPPQSLQHSEQVPRQQQQVANQQPQYQQPQQHQQLEQPPQVPHQQQQPQQQHPQQPMWGGHPGGQAFNDPTINRNLLVLGGLMNILGGGAPPMMPMMPYGAPPPAYYTPGVQAYNPMPMQLAEGQRRLPVLLPAAPQPPRQRGPTTTEQFDPAAPNTDTPPGNE